MGQSAKQMPLFARPAREPAPADPEFVRRHLTQLLRLAETSEVLPWSPAEAASWARLFSELAPLLHDDGAELHQRFEAQLLRLGAPPAP